MNWLKQIKHLGPGLVIAATGIGAGDLIAASVGGANYGYIVLWSAMVGAIIKYALNEGIARWQLDSGTSIIDGWRHHFPKWVSLLFLLYLVVWSFVVGAALSSACGLAAHTIFPFLSVQMWGILQAILALLLVLFFKYAFFERIMKFFIGFMFLLVIVTTIISQPDWGLVLKGILIPSLPSGSIWIVLGIIGGVGGSVTILSYGYWIKEKNWIGNTYMTRVKVDLIIAYILTGFFGIAIMVIAADVKPESVGGTGIVISLAEKIGETTGGFGKWIFLLGFWGAVFSSMLGVWNGVPFLFADFMKARRTSLQTDSNSTIEKQAYKRNYQLFLVYLSILPLVFLFFQKPVWIILIYAVTGSLFMPFLAFTLFWLNNKKNKSLKNPTYINILLWIAFLLFVVLMLFKIYEII